MEDVYVSTCEVSYILMIHKLNKFGKLLSKRLNDMGMWGFSIIKVNGSKKNVDIQLKFVPQRHFVQ